MVATAGRGWKLAPSLIALVREADELAPSRSTASDGSIGDPDHASRTSDHNPADGWVTAVDVTDDDSAGMNARALVDHIVATRDDRAKYVIHEGLIWRSYDKPGLPAWTPQKYTGSDGHFKHAHVSIHNTPAARNDTRSWFDSTVHEPTPLPEDPMAYQLDIAAYVKDCYREAGRDPAADRGGVNYWCQTAAEADDPKGLLNYMRGLLKLEPVK